MTSLPAWVAALVRELDPEAPRRRGRPDPALPPGLPGQLDLVRAWWSGLNSLSWLRLEPFVRHPPEGGARRELWFGASAPHRWDHRILFEGFSLGPEGLGARVRPHCSVATPEDLRTYLRERALCTLGPVRTLFWSLRTQPSPLLVGLRRAARVPPAEALAFGEAVSAGRNTAEVTAAPEPGPPVREGPAVLCGLEVEVVRARRVGDVVRLQLSVPTVPPRTDPLGTLAELRRWAEGLSGAAGDG